MPKQHLDGESRYAGYHGTDWQGRSIETKRAAAQAITETAVASLGVNREWVTILFEEYDHENWASGGELHIDKFGPGYGMTKAKSEE